MDNSFKELPRGEALARLYDLRNQLDLYDAERLAACAPVGTQACEDCGITRDCVRYGSRDLCEACAGMRIRTAALAKEFE